MIQGLQEPIGWWSAFRNILKGRDSMHWFICQYADRGAHTAGSSQLSITSSILQTNTLKAIKIREKLLPQTRSGAKCAQLWLDQIKRICVILWAQHFIWGNVHWAVQSVSLYPVPCRSDTLHWGCAPLWLGNNYRMDLEKGDDFLRLLFLHCLSYPAHGNIIKVVKMWSVMWQL